MLVGVVSGAAALGFGAVTIGLEVDRASMARGHVGNACTGVNTASAFCTALRDRRDERDVATGFAVGFGATVAPLLSANGAEFGVQGSF